MLTICPHCQKKYKVPEKRLGTEATCKFCFLKFNVRKLSQGTLVEKPVVVREVVRGVQRPAHRKDRTPILWVVFAVVGLGATIGGGIFLSNRRPPGPHDWRSATSNEKEWAETTVKRFLKRPRTARFGWLSETRHREDGFYATVGSFKSYNSLGQELDHEYSIVRDENWTLRIVEIDGISIYTKQSDQSQRDLDLSSLEEVDF